MSEDAPKGQWGISMPHGNLHAEQWVIDQVKVVPVQASDNVTQTKVLLYGPNGETLIEQRPRPVGFREPR